MGVTIKQIAEMAGVSAGTVDRALNNRKGVNKDVAKRIKSIAESLGYAPNIAAKALVTRRKAVKIGVVVHTKRHFFFRQVMNGVLAAAEEIQDYGVSVIIKEGREFDVEDQLACMEELAAQGIHGLALVPIHDQRIRDKILSLKAQGISVALMVSEEEVECLAYVGCDAYRVGRTLGGLVSMIRRGTAEALFLTPPLGIYGNMRRLQGFQDLCRERYPGIRLMEACEIPNDNLATYTVSMELLRHYPNTGIIVAANGFYEGLLRAIADCGMEGRVDVIALDLSEEVLKGLKQDQIKATVVQHPYEQGMQVINLIFQSIVMGKQPHRFKNYIECDIKIYDSLF